MRVLLTMVCCLAFSLLLGRFTSLYAGHNAWQDHYTTAGGVSCCGPRDCAIVQARLLSQTAEVSHAEVNGQAYTLPTRSIHPSEDAHDWACWMAGAGTPGILRCLFLAVGM